MHLCALVCEKTKEEAAQKTAGKCFQEEARNREATVRTQQKEQIFTRTKQTKMECCPDHVCVQQDFLLKVSK
jgi:hypothetical protein